MELPGVPGLIPGASQGKGLGTDSSARGALLHAGPRARLCELRNPAAHPAADLAAIEAELTAYGDSTGAELVRRPRLIALNKIDVPAAREPPRRR